MKRLKFDKIVEFIFCIALRGTHVHSGIKILLHGQIQQDSIYKIRQLNLAKCITNDPIYKCKAVNPNVFSRVHCWFKMISILNLKVSSAILYSSVSVRWNHHGCQSGNSEFSVWNRRRRSDNIQAQKIHRNRQSELYFRFNSCVLRNNNKNWKSCWGSKRFVAFYTCFLQFWQLYSCCQSCVFKELWQPVALCFKLCTYNMN